MRGENLPTPSFYFSILILLIFFYLLHSVSRQASIRRVEKFCFKIGCEREITIIFSYGNTRK